MTVGVGGEVANKKKVEGRRRGIAKASGWKQKARRREKGPGGEAELEAKEIEGPKFFLGFSGNGRPVEKEKRKRGRVREGRIAIGKPRR
ncbi:hypothetical protein Syun_022835 [Stephania yunnanensis]|uniref:Uncharacterized protein n=1 Tax=Stephania yunnanensis TaxID=152371 RepID=A0AAP0FLW5_9MAGN